ncbi:MAG: DUF2267 domain-containing protein [Kofleriaceae bacterium]|nr:DUF2267 domain-containing protein [Kofleriaceae bacterium]
MIPTTEAFAEHVASHAAATEAQAIQATRSVLAMLAVYASPEQRRFVAAELPASLATALNEPVNPDEFAASLEHVGEPPLRAGQAHELVASICRVLAEELSTEALELLRAVAPAELGRLLNPPGAEVTGRPTTRGYESLAAGKPGSAHPIADTPTERAQPESLAASTDGHEDTKLATAHGTTQERAHTTLAEGRPGFTRKLSGETSRRR